jgi:hypothetical protein
MSASDGAPMWGVVVQVRTAYDTDMASETPGASRAPGKNAPR